MGRRAILIGTTGAVLLAGTSAMAQNELSNPTFDAMLAPWTAVVSTAPDPVATGAASWTLAHNFDNMPGSGSSDTALNAAASQPANAQSGIRQCVTLPAPLAVTQVFYAASFVAPIAVNPTDNLGNATVEVQFYSDTACATDIAGAGVSQGAELTSGIILDDIQWWTIGDPLFVPPGGSIVVSSIEVRAFVRTVNTTSNGYRVFFDNVILGLNGNTPVELLQLEIE